MRSALLVLSVALVFGCGGSKSGTSDVAAGDSKVQDTSGSDSEVSAPEVAADIATEDQPTTGCIHGLRKCEQGNQIFECQGDQFVFIALCPAGEDCLDGSCVKLEDCKPGEVNGCSSMSALWKCNPSGTAWVPEQCPPDEACLEGICKKTECFPTQAKCLNAEQIQVCGDDGNWMEPTDCSQGNTCVGGKCINECLSDPKWNNSYIGCEYWTLDLDNYPDPYSPTQPDEAPHGVILANPGTATASISFKSFATGIPFNLLTTTVEPGDIRIVEMPRMDIDGSVITDRSVRIVSNRPVVAYQFNPLDFKAAYSDDSSLLLPAEMLGKEYLILNYPTSPLEAMPILQGVKSQHGYFTVLAIEEGETIVNVKVTAKTEHPDDADVIIEPGSFTQFKLQQGQVLNLQSTGKVMSGNLDLSGSVVIADKKVAVFSGHEEAVVSGFQTDPNTGEAIDCCCAEHLEEQLFPVSTWSTSYICVKARPRGGWDMDLWRIQASEPNTTITSDPPIPELEGKVLANKGDWIEVYTDKSFIVTATAPIQVAQYLQSGTCTDEGVGDPALIMAVPQSRYRTPYAFAVPKDYSKDYITVVRPTGTDVKLDGVSLADSSFKPLASTGEWEYGYFTVEDGPHMLESAQPIGLYQYGFQGPASYGHSGGLNLVKEN